MNSAKDLSILFLFTKPAHFIDLFHWFFSLPLFFSVLILIIFLFLITLDFVLFLVSLRCKVKLFEIALVFWGDLGHYQFLSLNCYSCVSKMWKCRVFIFLGLKIFISSLISLLTHWLFRNMLFSLHVFMFYLVFNNWILVPCHLCQRRY